MKPEWFFLLSLVIFFVLLLWANERFHLLRSGHSKATPFSYSRVQLAWWSIILLSAFSAVLFHTGNIAEPGIETVLLLGISVSTNGASKIIEALRKNSLEFIDPSKPAGFFMDILSDAGGISIHRFQSVLINLAYGIWYILQLLSRLDYHRYCNKLSEDRDHCFENPEAYILPEISDNNLLLIMLSALTYTVVKAGKAPAAKTKSVTKKTSI